MAHAHNQPPLCTRSRLTTHFNTQNTHNAWQCPVVERWDPRRPNVGVISPGAAAHKATTADVSPIVKHKFKVQSKRQQSSNSKTESQWKAQRRKGTRLTGAVYMFDYYISMYVYNRWWDFLRRIHILTNECSTVIIFVLLVIGFLLPQPESKLIQIQKHTIIHNIKTRRIFLLSYMQYSCPQAGTRVEWI